MPYLVQDHKRTWGTKVYVEDQHSRERHWWSSKRICLCWPLIIRATKVSERIKARVRHVTYRNSSSTDSKAKLMHLVFLHHPLSVLFLTHTLQHNGEWEVSAGATASCRETSYSVRTLPDQGLWQKMNRQEYDKGKKKATVRTTPPARQEPLPVMFYLSLPLCIILSHYFLPSCAQLPPGSSRHAGTYVYIYIYIRRMAQDSQISSSPIHQFYSNSGWQHLKWISIWQWSLWNEAMVQSSLTED